MHGTSSDGIDVFSGLFAVAFDFVWTVICYPEVPAPKYFFASCRTLHSHYGISGCTGLHSGGKICIIARVVGHVNGQLTVCIVKVRPQYICAKVLVHECRCNGAFLILFISGGLRLAFTAPESLDTVDWNVERTVIRRCRIQDVAIGPFPL